MNSIVLSLLVAFAGYSVQNISQATQKLGIHRMKIKSKTGVLIWGAATTGTGLSAIILLGAVSIGQVSLVGAMAGTGLISMTVYSRFILGERVNFRQMSGISLILVSALLIGLFAEEVSESVIAVNVLTVKLIIVSLVYSILWFIFRNKKRPLCVIIGGFSGALGGFVSQFQKISTSISVDSQMMTGSPAGLETLLNPFTAFWILLSISSMIVLQFAHKKGAATRVIPSFSANYTLIPVIGGVTCFGEILHPVQWLGVGMIITGVLIITMKAEI